MINESKSSWLSRFVSDTTHRFTRWVIKTHLRLVARELRKTAKEMVYHGDNESRKIAVQIRALACRVTEYANKGGDES